MKNRTAVSILILVVAVLIIVGSCATGKSAYREDYKFLAGTWVNKEYDSSWKYAKLITYPDGRWESYFRISDKGIADTGYYIIVDKWTDSEGNIWYKTKFWAGEVIIETEPTWYKLDRISKSGNVWEYVSLTANYPSELNINHTHYHIRYRQE